MKKRIANGLLKGLNQAAQMEQGRLRGCEEFKELLSEARDQAKKAGMKKSDVNVAIKRVRRKK